MFEADSQNFAAAPSVPRGVKASKLSAAFGRDHRGTQGGGGVLAKPPSPQMFHLSIAKAAVAPPLWPRGPEEATMILQACVVAWPGVAWHGGVLAEGSSPYPMPIPLPPPSTTSPPPPPQNGWSSIWTAEAQASDRSPGAYQTLGERIAAWADPMCR